MKSFGGCNHGGITNVLLGRVDNIHFASIVLLDIIKGIDRCEDSLTRLELIKERDMVIKNIISLSSMEV